MKEVIFKLPDEVLTLIVHKVANAPQEASLLEKWIYDGEVRKTGKWFHVKGGGLFRNNFRCSACGNFLDFNGVNAGRGDANYCPNCGAKMEVDE